MGSGMVVIIDGSEMKNLNHDEVENDMALHVEDLKVHLLIRGDKFLLGERKFVSVPKENISAASQSL
jgi:cyanophycinase